jgi:hypothetical protein
MNALNAKVFACCCLVCSFSTYAACTFPDQNARVIYGGQQGEREPSITLICASRSKAATVQRPQKPSSDAMPTAPRLDAMDKDGVSLILSRELANTEAELAKVRNQSGSDPKEMSLKIRRLEGDVAALQAELARAQKR